MSMALYRRGKPARAGATLTKPEEPGLIHLWFSFTAVQAAQKTLVRDQVTAIHVDADADLTRMLTKAAPASRHKSDSGID